MNNVKERLEEIKKHTKQYGISLQDMTWLIEQLEKLLPEEEDKPDEVCEYLNK